MYLDEARPNFGDGVGPYIDRIQICRAKWDVHVLKSFKANPSSFLSTNVLNAKVKTNGDMETFG